MIKKLKREYKYNNSNEKLNQALDLLQKEINIFGGDLASEILKRVSNLPVKDGTDYYKGYLIDLYKCPDCGAPTGDDIVAFNFCPKCGKKLMK